MGALYFIFQHLPAGLVHVCSKNSTCLSFGNDSRKSRFYL